MVPLEIMAPLVQARRERESAELVVEFVRNYKLMMLLRLGTGTKRRFCCCLNWYIIATSSTINMFVVVRNSPLCAAL